MTMKRIIEIHASFTGVISTSQFENEKPLFALKETLELPDELIEKDGETFTAPAMSNEVIKARQKELHELCYSQFQAQAERAYQEKLAGLYRNIRWYPGKDGKKYPSVTSIIGWDEDFRVPPDELAQYGSRGTIIHKQVELFLKTNEWKEPKDIPEIYPDLVIIKNGNLGLEHDNVDFQQFYKDYPFKVISLEDTVVNDDYRYGGRLDIHCIIEKDNPGKWAKVDGIQFDVPTILDVKTGSSLDKTKGFKQQTAYAKCLPEVKQIGLIHLTKENKCGYAKPVVLDNLNKYWHLFLKDLDNFNNRYGLGKE